MKNKILIVTLFSGLMCLTLKANAMMPENNQEERKEEERLNGMQVSKVSPFDLMPMEILKNTLEYLNNNEIPNVSCVSKQFSKAIDSNDFKKLILCRMAKNHIKRNGIDKMVMEPDYAPGHPLAVTTLAPKSESVEKAIRKLKENPYLPFYVMQTRYNTHLFFHEGDIEGFQPSLIPDKLSVIQRDIFENYYCVIYAVEQNGNQHIMREIRRNLRKPSM